MNNDLDKIVSTRVKKRGLQNMSYRKLVQRVSMAIAHAQTLNQLRAELFAVTAVTASECTLEDMNEISAMIEHDKVRVLK